MELRDHYDWVVLGDHPGALLGAGLAAKLGLSVLIAPLNPSHKLLISKKGMHLDPESSFILGLGQTAGSGKGLLARCLEQAGILSAEGEAILARDSAPQVATPGQRFSLGSDQETLSRELARELGATSAEALGLIEAMRSAELDFLRYWNGMPERLTILPEKGKDGKPSEPRAMAKPRPFVSRAGGPGRPGGDRRLRKGDAAGMWLDSSSRVSQLPLRHGQADFTAGAEGILEGATCFAAENPMLREILQALVLSRSGARFRGGLSAYRELLLRLARRLGAHVVESSECKRIFVENGRFVGIQLAQKGNMTGGGAAILGTSLSQVADKINYSGKSLLRQLKSGPAPVGWRFTIALEVHAEAIPPGMASRLVWKEAGSPALELEHAPPGEYGGRNAGNRYLFLRAMMPFTLKSLEPEPQRLMAARMLRQAMELLPYLEYHIVRIFPDFREPGEAALGEAYGFSTLEEIPDNLRVFSGPGTGSFSGIDGLFLSSGEAYPELGSFGGTVAALESVAWLAHRSGLAGPLS